MGYNLTIGEAVFEVDKVGDDEWTTSVQDEYIRVTAESVKLPDAPAFDEPTDYTNERWPSYTTWHDFCEATGLWAAIYVVDEHGNNTGNMRGGHPGYFPITPAFQKEVHEAYDNWMAEYPDAVAEYTKGEDGEYIEANSYLCRLEWLKFWTDWALENCKVPVFVNS